MKLIPYFINTEGSEWIKLSVFLRSGGREIWELDDGDKDKTIKKMLEENGFPVLDMKREPGHIFASINSKAIKMGEFYSWAEVDPATSDEDIWRDFLIPRSLWSCSVFRDHYCKSSGLSTEIMGHLRHLFHI
jgi:hypothetical protein